MLLRLNEVYGEAAASGEKPVLSAIKAEARRAIKDRW
jgi:hypothetical protein